MRKETQQIAEALLNKQSKSMARTKTDGENLYLHGNRIATVKFYPFGGIQSISMTLAGFPTNTTRERLNGLIQSFAYRMTGNYTLASFTQRKGKQFYTEPSGKAREIDSRETIVLSY